ncbi:MAG: translation elongation factor Ts [Desulfobacteraceae bacterium]|nr:MAG: translation elongation factor Ts [Desulfobacteraceae bacterium]
MTTISADMVKTLRARTGAGIMDCKQALATSDGDMDAAVDFLRQKGLATAQKRAGREASEGTIQSYIHMGGKIGVLVEINCETDFVAKTDDFQTFARNIAMQIAAARPLGVNPEDIPESVIAKEKEIYRLQALEMGKPEKMLDKIVEGKMSKFYKDSCLMNQEYVRDTSLTITDVLNDFIAKTGEKVTIRRFARFQIGE